MALPLGHDTIANFPEKIYQSPFFLTSYSYQ